MDIPPLLFLLLSSILCLFLVVLGTRNHRRKMSIKLPPGPFPLPIIGNLLLLRKSSHRSLMKLSQTYGPLIYLKFGVIHSIVVSSPEMAKEVLQKQDKTCCARIVPHTAHGANHYLTSIAWLPAGSKWRRFRRMYIEELLTEKKMIACEDIRQEKLRQLGDYLQECCTTGRVVEIGHVAFVTMINLMWGILFSLNFCGYDSSSGHEIKEVIEGITMISGTPNIADFFPVLRGIDPQSLKRKADKYYGKLLVVLEEIVAERLQQKESCRKMDLLEALIQYYKEDEDQFSLNDIKHLLLDLITGGPDTTSFTVEWAMTELLLHPEKMLRLQTEITSVIGKANPNGIQERDIHRLPYLQAVIKETFRRHPAIPVLPHMAQEDVEINGYTIPRGSQILVNVWAMGRDSSVWPDPDRFEPERFLERKIEYTGHDFELISFGSGRRMCPGMPLASRMVHLMVATLVQNFEWELPTGMKREDVNTVEISGITLHKVAPLRASPSNRED